MQEGGGGGCKGIRVRASAFSNLYKRLQSGVTLNKNDDDSEIYITVQSGQDSKGL